MEKPQLTWSVFRRLKVTKGEDWWVDESRPGNGIGLVCLYCENLIDWGPTDHGRYCPVRKFMRWGEAEVCEVCGSETSGWPEVRNCFCSWKEVS